MNRKIKKLNAFTLAEVLITLGVIGVVAAVTLPTLVQNYKKQVATARLKNFYSTMQQAILMSEAVNGPSKDWEFSRAVYDSNGVYDSVGNRTFVYNFISKYLLPYMNYDKITKETNKDIELYFKDASVIKFGHGSCIDLRYDINGTSNPNIIGRDIFTFVFCFPATDPNNPKVIGFHSYDKFSCKTRQTALEKCKTNINYCSTLLQYDNWEFKDDYKFKEVE